MRDEPDPRSAVDAGPDRSWVAEQLAAARARQEPEGEPEVPALGAALRELAADWGETLLVAWNGPYGRDLRLAARAGAHAALAAIATWLAAVTMCVAVWLVSAPNTAGITGPLRVGGQLWLLGHHAALDVPAGRIALAPLGFTALVVFALWQTAVAPVDRPVHLAYTAFGAATGYCLVAALVASGAATGDVHPDTAQAVLFAVLFGALVPTAARWRRIAGFCDAPRWVSTAARAAATAGAVLIGGGALALAGTLIAHLPEAGWPRGIADVVGMFLLSLAVLPNAVAWSASFVLGPGFAVGTGTGVSVLSAKVGALPVFPLLGALPRNGSRIFPYDLAFLVLPVLAGVALALVVTRAGHHALGDRVRALSAAAVVVALLAGLAATLSGGPLAGGRMATLGPSGWRTAAATLLLLGVTAAAVVLAPPLLLAVRGLSGLPVGRLLPGLRGVGRLLHAVAVLRPRRRAEVGPGLALPDEYDRQQADQQGGDRADLVDDRDPAVGQVADAAQDADAEEDGGDDAGVVVPAAGGQGHPEPEPGADEAADDGAADEDALVAVDGGVGVPERPQVVVDGVDLGESDDHVDQADAQADEHQVDGDPD
ncbi:hypothetical protein ABH920_001089 [Catenulispora sp. EB89]|uniref:cell division protein PerM n=1 Tax=Catenulispora sp. EB89 TaxID=3156257 RepID=UPI0035142656